MTTYIDENFMNQYMVIRPESTDLPELRRYDIKMYEFDTDITSSWREYRNGELINYMGMYDVPIDLQEFGNYAILDAGEGKHLNAQPTYMKYPSGKYVIALKGWNGKYKDVKEIPYEKLPPHIQEREYNRNLIYKNRGTERCREEHFQLDYRPKGIYKRIFIDDNLICVIEDYNIEKIDAHNKKHVIYYVIWPDRSREAWYDGVFFSHEEKYTKIYPIDDLFPTTTALATIGSSGHTVQETLAQLRLLAN